MIDRHPDSTPLRLNGLVSDRPLPDPDKPLPLAILPGEGIGPELIAACQPILEAVQASTPYRFEVEYGGKIGREALAESGHPLPQAVVDFCGRNFERGAPLFCGPGGDRFVYQLRTQFDIYCKFVPVRPLPEMLDLGPLRERAVRGVDLVLVRDNVGGVYQGVWSMERMPDGRRAHHSFHYDETKVRRIIGVAVAAAARRRRQLCVIHKPGGTPAISELWVDVARQCTRDTQVELRFLEADTAAYLLIADARSFDVLVTPNLFGDMLGDVAALLLGSRGMSYSFNVSESGYAVYQTAHGAAYDLAGRGTANPLGQIQTLAALFRESFGLAWLADALLDACRAVLEAGMRTADIQSEGGKLLSTVEIGQAVAQQFSLALSRPRHPCNRT